jgi:hypothetical protein
LIMRKGERYICPATNNKNFTGRDQNTVQC